MKKLLTLAVATTALVSVPAFAADTDTVDLLVNATVLDECSIENPTDVTFATVNINEGAGANALLLKNGNQHDTQNIYVSCNYAAKLTAPSANGGLLNAPGTALAAHDPSDFTNLPDYHTPPNPTHPILPHLCFHT